MKSQGIGRVGHAALIWLAASASTCHAASAVDVTLQAAFDAPPYLVELLETAADENATAYFPLLDQIAHGHFDKYTTDKQLYDAFVSNLQESGHLTTSEDLSTFNLALSAHSAAPRIEAHYQFYNTTARHLIQSQEEDECEAWVALADKKYCNPYLTGDGESISSKHDGIVAGQLPFDRMLGGGSTGAVPTILYADITSPTFRKFHETIRLTASTGKTSYRLRHKPQKSPNSRALFVSGYGVAMSLKRTDYIVIDDRKSHDTPEAESKPSSSGLTLEDESVADLKPLSASELRELGLRAGSFVLASEDKLDTLLKLSQDFPKHSKAIAAAELSEQFKAEALRNSQTFIPSGYNAIWLNGQQCLDRDLDVFALLERLRRERKLISSGKALGLSGQETLKLISYGAQSQAQAPSEPIQRYDWRDDVEGNNVIIWLNDIEKDIRYQDWPNAAQALMQRVFPGQLPQVRKDIHNVILPINFADKDDVLIVVENIQAFVQRKIPVRFGLVPLTHTANAEHAASIIYHIASTYEVAYALNYLESIIPSLANSAKPPSASLFDDAIEGLKPRAGHEALDLDAVPSSIDVQRSIEGARSYLKRLGADDALPPYIVNGVPVAKGDDWMSQMSDQVGNDVQLARYAVHTGAIDDETWIAGHFIKDATLKRNSLIIPEKEKDTRFVNLADHPELKDGYLGSIPSVPASDSTVETELVQLLVAGDLDDPKIASLVKTAIDFRTEHDNVELFFVHTGIEAHESGLTGSLRQAFTAVDGVKLVELRSLADAASTELSPSNPVSASRATLQFWQSAGSVIEALGHASESFSVVLNGRVVSGNTSKHELTLDDFEMLLNHERKKRLTPAVNALKSLSLLNYADKPYSFARLSNLIALSKVSDTPEGIFEAPPPQRMSVPDNVVLDFTSFEVGDAKSASVFVLANIDPASQTAQKWLPIIKVLSELSNVHVKVILSPQTKLEELPVKRFYRQVVSSTPSFDESGSLTEHGAHFVGLPSDALLTIGMDLPPAWLVSPKDSVHDLDNLRISSLNTDEVRAVYQLDHILIEGHSEEAKTKAAPRGAQLVLSTGYNEKVADTIIMANLGYFQFKANPGFYNLSLQKGRSQEIFTIDSAGVRARKDVLSQHSTGIALLSFRGATLFPLLARKAGMEQDDVLEPSKSSLDKTMESLGETAEGVTKVIGLDGKSVGNWFSKAAKKVASTGTASKAVSTLPHADINIFSVASGHLYERMLNIMMVSVMKHTSHTVKFWFIEQFLSPSFKAFLPLLAEEYGFRYEMVTFKWPHWLRGQTEKQREIWGYKILFLDVLFPLDLDKVIFVDADQIVRTDMYELVQYDLKGAPYGFTPMCDSRTEMEGFRFWKQGYWANFLRGLPYHISALYVVDLAKFRQMAAGDRLRQQYHQLSADPESLSNLDQDLPNHMQHVLPIHSLPQEWLWCETWCSDESLGVAKTIDLCNNPQTKEPKLERARRQVPEWTVYDDEIAALAKHKQGETVAPGRGEGTGEQEKLQAEEYKRKQEEEKRKESEKPQSKDEL